MAPSSTPNMGHARHRAAVEGPEAAHLQQQLHGCLQQVAHMEHEVSKLGNRHGDTQHLHSAWTRLQRLLWPCL
jgi:hypothetical protein